MKLISAFIIVPREAIEDLEQDVLPHARTTGACRNHAPRADQHEMMAARGGDPDEAAGSFPSQVIQGHVAGQLRAQERSVPPINRRYPFPGTGVRADRPLQEIEP